MTATTKTVPATITTQAAAWYRREGFTACGGGGGPGGGGWNWILSDLKSLLETGRTMGS